VLTCARERQRGQRREVVGRLLVLTDELSGDLEDKTEELLGQLGGRPTSSVGRSAPEHDGRRRRTARREQ